MSSIREIKQRVKNIKSVDQIIHAMHMVSSTKLKKMEEQLFGARPIQLELEKKIEQLKRIEGVENLKYFEKRKIKNTLYVIFTSDQGFSGSYNSRVQKMALEHMEDKNEQILVIGRKGEKFFIKNKKNIVRSVLNISDSKTYYGSLNISQWILNYYLSGKTDEVYLINLNFDNLLSYKNNIQKVLPLEYYETHESLSEIGPNLKSYTDELVSFYLHMSIFRAFSESHTSEQASRMVNMDTAGKNAKELIEDLVRKQNKQRQAEITQELSEIVGQKQNRRNHDGRKKYRYHNPSHRGRC